MKKLFILLAACIIALNSFAQTNLNDSIQQMTMKAIALMDSGYIEPSIEILEKLKILDPKDFTFDFEIGYAYLLKEDYKTALKYYKKALKYPNATDQCHQMVGNVLDMLGKTKKAIKAYDKGLKLFPNSGRLYLEKGTLYYNQKNYNLALDYYEKGIFVEPTYSSNYYRATMLYLNSTEELWGMIYGEIFMNLEPNSKRTYYISKLLYDTYKSEIQITSDTSYSVSFSSNNTINITLDDLKSNPESLMDRLTIPFGVGVYEPTLLLSVINVDSINLESLHRIRTNFVENYYKNEHYRKYPINLFEHQKLMKDLGYLEAYNYWILSEGNNPAFEAWLEENQETWDKFVEWFLNNPMLITDKNKFHSSNFQ